LVIRQLTELYRFRALVHVLIQRDLKVRYRGTILGFLWSFVNPLVLMMTYVLVFSVFMRIDMDQYPAFLLCGILPWSLFSSGLTEASNAIIANGGLIRKIYLPPQIFPLVSISSHLVHYLLSIPILLLFLTFFGRYPSWFLLLFPVILAIQFIFTYSLALIVSSLSVRFRDLLHVVPNLLLIWFFLTPIIYPATLVPEQYRTLLNFNPIASIILAYQDIFFYNRFPSEGSLMLTAGLAGLLLVVSLWICEKRKDSFAEAM